MSTVTLIDSRYMDDVNLNRLCSGRITWTGLSEKVAAPVSSRDTVSLLWVSLEAVSVEQHRQLGGISHTETFTFYFCGWVSTFQPLLTLTCSSWLHTCSPSANLDHWLWLQLHHHRHHSGNQTLFILNCADTIWMEPDSGLELLHLMNVKS